MKRKKTNLTFPIVFVLALVFTGLLIGTILHFESRIKVLKSDVAQKTDMAQQQADASEDSEPAPQTKALPVEPARMKPPAVSPTSPSAQKPPRHLSDEQAANLQSGLKDIADDLAGANLYVATAADSDSQKYAKELTTLFAQSGIKLIAASPGNAAGNHGLLLKVSNKDMPSKEARLLFEALRDAGLNVSFANWADDNIDNKSIELVIGAR